jgi:hypothetical protein
MINMIRLFLYSVLISFVFWGCQGEPESGLEATDLMSYGIPVSIMAPDSAVIKKRDMAGGLIKDVSIQAGENFDIQIIASAAETNDMASIKADLLANVKGNRYYSRIVEEHENGFIYETAIDSTFKSYGFRYILVQGDQEILFQSGLAGDFSLEMAKAMYEAVQQ